MRLWLIAAIVVAAVVWYQMPSTPKPREQWDAVDYWAHKIAWEIHECIALPEWQRGSCLERVAIRNPPPPNK